MNVPVARDMLSELETVLDRVPVIPVLVIENADDAVPIAKALAAGGLPIAEVTFCLLYTSPSPRDA